MPYGGSVQVSAKLRKGEWSNYWNWVHWCPACAKMHQFRVPKNGGKGIDPNIPDWTFDGNLERPTFAPSMLIFTPEWKDKRGTTHARHTLCHYVLTAGIINYCGDCPHSMRGTSIPLPDLPAEYRD